MDVWKSLKKLHFFLNYWYFLNEVMSLGPTLYFLWGPSTNLQRNPATDMRNIRCKCWSGKCRRLWKQYNPLQLRLVPSSHGRWNPFADDNMHLGHRIPKSKLGPRVAGNQQSYLGVTPMNHNDQSCKIILQVQQWYSQLGSNLSLPNWT